jgi:hypothetical protein
MKIVEVHHQNLIQLLYVVDHLFLKDFLNDKYRN